MVFRAVESVMSQTFGDFEIIVSDNSDRTLPKTDFLDKTTHWGDDPRVRCVQPPEPMSMPAHWNFATNFATGKYVAILTDRFVMRPSSLEALAQTILANNTGTPNLVVWNVESSYSEDTHSLVTPKTKGQVKITSSQDLLSDFLKFRHWKTGSCFFNKLPRGLNNIYKREIALEIIKKHGPLFRPRSPDYTSSFLFLAFVPEVIYLDLPLYIAHGNQSNGLKCLLYGVNTYVSGVEPRKLCPMQVDTVFNTIAEDFLAIKELVHPRLRDFEIDTVGYFLSNYKEFIDKELLGSPLDLRPLYLTWRDALAKLPFSQQMAIREGVQIIDKMRPSAFLRMKRKMIRRCHLDSLRNRLREFTNWLAPQDKERVAYANVIEAAVSTDDCVRDYVSSSRSFVR